MIDQKSQNVSYRNAKYLKNCDIINLEPNLHKKSYQ